MLIFILNYGKRGKITDQFQPKFGSIMKNYLCITCDVQFDQSVSVTDHCLIFESDNTRPAVYRYIIRRAIFFI